jgi:hypothetical protein
MVVIFSFSFFIQVMWELLGLFLWNSWVSNEALLQTVIEKCCAHLFITRRLTTSDTLGLVCT